MNIDKKNNIVCFSVDELARFYKITRGKELFREIGSRGYTLKDLEADKAKVTEVIDKVWKENIKHKENIEILAALDSCLNFYDNDSKICFGLNDSVDLTKTPIKDLDDLILLSKENSITDFFILNAAGYRQFQLKQYQGDLVTENLLDFIKSVLSKYGCNLGEVNLLIILQGPKSDPVDVKKLNVDFQELYEKIKELQLTFPGQILIEYNEENKNSVINEVYPELKSMSKELRRDSLIAGIL